MKNNGVPKIEYSGKEPASSRANYKKKDRIVDPGFPVDPMGYWNPANVGKIVQVPTENGHITMRGVDQPLIGMDEHGNTQYQMPGMEYHYPGNFITEYPIAKDGGWLDTMQEGGSKNPEWYNGKLATGSKYPLPPADKRRIPQSGMVVDKRTNQAYYFGDKGETGNFPVLTGKNPDGNINTYSLSDLKENSKLRNTPTGYYTINKESTYKSPDMLQHYAGMMRDVEPIPAFGVPAPKSKDLGFHLTYMDPFNPAVYKNRDSLYRGKEYDRNASYGCVNCEKESYEAFNKAVPKTDTMMVLDSKNYADRILLEQAKSRMKTKPLMEDGGWLDEVEEFRRGGQKGLKKFTSKNIATSVNDIMMRNVTLFGPAGKKRYKPGLKFEEGGESNEMQYGGSSVVDYLISKGQDYSKQHRAQLAKEYGVSDYDFTAEKNLELLDKLKNSKPVSQKPIAKTQAQSYLMKPIEKENSRGTDRTGQTKKVHIPTKEEIAYAQLPKEIKLQIAAQNKTPDQLRETKSQGKMSKAWDVVSHPMTALRELNTYGYIPDNLSQHPDKNPLDMAVDIVNPAFYANAAGRLAKASVNPNTYFDLAKTAGYLTTSLAGDQAPKGFDESAVKTLGVVGDVGALFGLGELSGLNKMSSADAILDTHIGKKLINKLGEKKLKSIMPEAFNPVELLTEEGAKKVSNINNFANRYEAVTKDSYINGLRQKGFTPKEAKELARREASKFLGEYDLTGLHPDIIENVTGKTLSEIAAEYEALATAKEITPSSKAVNYIPKQDAPLNLNTIKKDVSEISKIKSKKQYLEADPTGIYSENLNPFEKFYRDQILKRTVKNKFGMPMSTAEEFLLAEENQMIPIIESSTRSNPMADLFQAAQRGKSAPKGTPYMSGSSLSDNSFPISLAMTKKALRNNEVTPMFMGYGPLNKMGHLSKYGNDPKLTLDFINSEIAKFNEGLANNIKIPNAFLKGEDVFYPRLGLKNKKYGGGWLDNIV